jgi:4-hydroxy-tetrahydrodipicolinate reductase
MKLALIGYGAMGRLVANVASGQGHEVVVTLNSRDCDRSAEDLARSLRSCDVVFDFSVAAAVLRNVTSCVLAGLPLVEGTTGWQGQLDEVKSVVAQNGGALVYGPNFSIGVNLFYRVAAHAATLFAAVEDYAPFIEEAHHARKRDAPSGTALRLRELMAQHLKREIPITSTRAGYIPGTHRVGFDSTADQILLEHVVRSREGFAAGALLAARWIVGRKGVYEFSEVIDEILQTPQRHKGTEQYEQ